MKEKHVSEQNEIVLYQPDEQTKLEVRVENETVWLNVNQMAELFGRDRTVITRHISNIFKEGEVDISLGCAKFALSKNYGRREGFLQTSLIDYYNLDVIISVGYRVHSAQGVTFRRWATSVLKDYMLRGYALNQRLLHIENELAEHHSMLQKHQDKIDFFVRTSLPPVEGVFYNGQIFEAYAFVADLIKGAKKCIVLIDNYVDESVLTLLDKRNKDVTAIIYTQAIDKQLRLDIDKHNAQYAKVDVQVAKTFHDRFLIIDNVVYHVGASIKDLGKKLFAFSKMEMRKESIIEHL